MNIGKAIKQIRISKGISQLSLGLAIGNDAAYISRIENNKKEPNLKTLIKLAEALEVEALDLLQLIINSD